MAECKDMQDMQRYAEICSKDCTTVTTTDRMRIKCGSRSSFFGFSLLLWAVGGGSRFQSRLLSEDDEKRETREEN